MRRMLVIATAALAVAVLSAGCLAMAKAASGYEAWKVTVTSYVTMGGDHAIRVYMKARNTGTVATVATCYAEAYSPKWRQKWLFGTATSISFAVVPGHTAKGITALIRVPAPDLAGDQTAIYGGCG